MIYAAAYFGVGALYLIIFDLVTGRIRSKFDWAVTESQLSLNNAMVMLSRRAVKLLFLFMLWLFWPAVLYGSVTGHKGGNHGTS